jgi:hypothetical protein
MNEFRLDNFWGYKLEVQTALSSTIIGMICFPFLLMGLAKILENGKFLDNIG